jgi:hypothetical protein
LGRILKTRNRSYDFRVYNYNASVVVGWRFHSKQKKVFLVFKAHKATRGVENFYSADVVPNSRS